MRPGKLIIKVKPLPENFVKYINENCYVDEHTGGLVCKHCGCTVVPDFFEKSLECQGCDEL